MAQGDFGTIAPTTTSGSTLATELGTFRDAVQSGNKGPSAPSYAQAGTPWIDDTVSALWVLKRYDGADWITEGYYDTSANVFITATPAATTSAAGLMSATDKTKLNGVASGATANLPQGRVALTDGATPALNAALGDTFDLTALGDRVIAVPSNPTDGQKITIRHLASGGARTLGLNTGAGGFRFGSDITGLTATASGKTDYIGCIYNAAATKWDVVAVIKGF